ncbi:MAG: hypothetical protein P8164_07875 [Gammaproteobacteria bacterium]
MPYTIAQDRTLALVELTFSRLISGADLKDATAECATLQRETGVTRFRLDGRDQDVVGSVVDIFDLPAGQYWKEKLYTRTRIAVVLPDSARSREAVFLYENACRNRAGNAHVHPSRQSALAWLAEVIEAQMARLDRNQRAE